MDDHEHPAYIMGWNANALGYVGPIPDDVAKGCHYYWATGYADCVKANLLSGDGPHPGQLE